MINMIDDVMKILLSSLIPIIVTGLYAWIGSRNAQSKRKQTLEDAKQRIELINSYVASQKLVIDDATELGVVKKTATDELYKIKVFLDNNLSSLEISSEKLETYWQRFFLLYKMRTWMAGFFRVGFFIILFISILFTIILTIGSFTPSSIQEYGLGFNIVMIVIASIPGILIAMLLRWLAIKFDKPASTISLS